ncbi:MAG: 50S ribosomal protein L19 [Epsilonproteobacteria bacterium]|nr:50S ribosomal protein L19 [Campylobacterota bacterium]
MNKIDIYEKPFIADKQITDFRVGDSVKVYLKIREGNKERIQVYDGTVIRKRGHGLSSSFTVRKTSYGIGSEKIFPLYCPSIEKVEIVSRGKVRRSRLYYLRERSGKAARIKKRSIGEIKNRNKD